MKVKILFIIISFLAFSSCDKSQEVEMRDGFKSYYDEFHVDGSFVIYDQQKNKLIIYNQPQLKQTFSPASTFKICNSLIGIETGVIKDENFLIPWDSVVRNPVWDKDHDLKTAYANSTVWYYQELARRVGGEKMKYWIDKVNYGNKDTTGGIDQFWLSGGLRISPEQQLEFLQKLHKEELPFSKRTLNIVKKVMIERDTLDYTLRGKTGWGGDQSNDIGWYIGYLVTQDNVYYFVNCVQMESKKMEDVNNAILFDHSRKQIAWKIFADLGIIKENIKP